jgi:hypothetical protein
MRQEQKRKKKKKSHILDQLVILAVRVTSSPKREVVMHLKETLETERKRGERVVEMAREKVEKATIQILYTCATFAHILLGSQPQCDPAGLDTGPQNRSHLVS